MNLRHRFRLYWTIFNIATAERLTYRADFFFGTLMRFLPIVTTIFLWQSIFDGSTTTRIAGLTSHEMIAYYLLVTVARAFSSMPGLATGIAAEIRGGEIKKYLLQPIDLVGYWLATRLAHKLVYYVIAAFPFALVFYLCRGFFSGWPSTMVLVAFIVSLIMAFLIGFLFEAMIGLLGFWVLETSAFVYLFMTIVYLLSGHMFPIGLLPEPMASIVRSLPFAYLAYFPAMLFLHGDEWGTERVLRELATQAIWVLFLAFAIRVQYARGLRQYSAFGG